MPTAQLQQWIKFDRQRRDEIETYRAALLDGTFRHFAVIGAIAMTLGSWRAVRDGQWAFAAVYLSMYIGGIVFAVTYKKLSLRVRANVLLSAMFLLSVAVLLRIGLGGPGTLLLVASCGLTGVLRGIRASLLAVGGSVILMGVVGYAMVAGHLTLAPDRMYTSVVASAWIVTAFVFIAASAGLVVPLQMLSVRLGESLDSLETRTEELEASNAKLRDEVQLRQDAEEALASARKMEAIGTLAGGIAHDFNNLLMGIQGYTSLILAHGEPTERQRDYLKSVEKLVENGATLTGQLLGFARRGKYDARPTDLRDLLERSMSIFGRAKRELRTHLRVVEDLHPVEVDQAQIEQVLLNLFINSSQAMNDGGELFVEAHNLTVDAAKAGAFELPTGDYVQISIRDTGKGMDTDTQRRAFEPFFTTKPRGRGTGLGLASAYGIIKNHGGTIDLHSEVGKGATFTITLPATGRPLPVEEAKPTGQPEGKETILVVDDEPAILEITELFLGELGYHVLPASNGFEALRIFKENKGSVALVILDMIMPEMSGQEVFEELRTIAPDVRVLLASGYSQDEKTEAALSQGAVGFMQKPFSLTTLTNKLRAILENH